MIKLIEAEHQQMSKHCMHTILKRVYKSDVRLNRRLNILDLSCFRPGGVPFIVGKAKCVIITHQRSKAIVFGQCSYELSVAILAKFRDSNMQSLH